MQRAPSSKKSRNTRDCFCSITSAAHTLNATGSCQALELGSRWLRGESSVLGRQGYPDPRDIDAMRKAPPCSNVIYFAWSKSGVGPHKNHQVLWFCLVWLGLFWGFVSLGGGFRLYIACPYSVKNDVTPGCIVCTLGCLLA